MCQSLDLGLSLVLARFDRSLLALFELVATEQLSLTVAADLIELAHKLSVFKVEQVLIGALSIQILFIIVKGIEVRIEILFVVVSHRA